MAAVESLLTSLRANATTKLRLQLDIRSDMPRLLQALQASTSVEEVNVDIYETFQQREEEVLELFGTLSRLPALRRLWVDSGREASPFYTLSVAALALVLQQAPQLQALALYDVELAAGTLEEWEQFETAVAQHPSLQNFGLVKCRLAVDTVELLLTRQQTEENSDTTCYALSRLVGISLANLPTLQWVELTGQEFEALGELTPQSLESLCQSSSLTKLTLDSFDLKDAHIAAMAGALETSSTIDEWKITCELGRMGCTALAQLLFVNTSLSNFTLQLNELMDDLSSHDNHATKKPKNDPIYAVAQALERNQSLQYFTLTGYAKISKTSQEAFATLLGSNTTLLHCEIDLQNVSALSDDLQREADLMLKLNELGRKRLLQGQASPQEWVTALWEVRRNLDGLYYLLSMNPMLCDIDAAGSNSNQSDAAADRPTYSGLSHLQYKYLLG